MQNMVQGTDVKQEALLKCFGKFWHTKRFYNLSTEYGIFFSKSMPRDIITFDDCENPIDTKHIVHGL